jgi:hypothetical protein
MIMPQVLCALILCNATRLVARSPSIAHQPGEDKPSTNIDHLPAPPQRPAPATAPLPSYSDVQGMKADVAHRDSDQTDGSFSMGILNMTSSLRSIFNEDKGAGGDTREFGRNIPFAWNLTAAPIPESGGRQGDSGTGSVGLNIGEREQASRMPSSHPPFSTLPPASGTAAPLDFDREEAASLSRSFSLSAKEREAVSNQTKQTNQACSVPAESLVKIYGCEHKCGFHGLYEQVCALYLCIQPIR